MVVSRFSTEFSPSDWKNSSDFYLSITQVVITANVTWLHSLGFKNPSDRIKFFSRLLPFDLFTSVWSARNQVDLLAAAEVGLPWLELASHPCTRR